MGSLFRKWFPSQAKVNKPTGGPTDLRHIVRLLSRFLVGERRLFILALLMLVAEAATAVFEAYPLAYLIDFLKGDRPDLLSFLGWPAIFSPLIDTIALLTAGIILMAMINSLADSMAEIYLAKGGRMLGYNLRTALYSHLQRLSLAFHDKRRTGDILTRVTGDVTALEDFVIGSLSDIVGSVLVLIGTMAFLLYSSWQVSIVAAVIVPVMAFVSNYFSQRIKEAVKKQRAREGDLASAAQEMLTSIRVIQTYSRAGYEQQRFAEHSQKTMDAALVAAGLQARFSWVVKVLEAVAISVVVWLGLWLMGQFSLTVGTLVLFVVLIQNMFKPTRKIIKEWNTIGKLYASAERIGELLDRKPTVVDQPGAMSAPPFRGAVEFREVSFAYQPDPEEAGEREGPPLALNGINFSIAPGEVLALVGHTGAGKSTIAQLLPRLYDPSAGQVLIDGSDIRTFTLDSLRSQISFVLQETILFSGSVAENIAYGRTDATREEIIEAAIQANAHEFIDKMPDGYDTLLGERGANLSGGQRQRIAIARAFIRNTPILILDEPTTGLDVEAAELVLLALRTLMNGKTTIIISHDLKLIRHADKIVVLKAGEIEQVGRHQELLQAEGLYATLYFKQLDLLEMEPDLVGEPEAGLSGPTPAETSANGREETTPKTTPSQPEDGPANPSGSRVQETGASTAFSLDPAQLDLRCSPTLQQELPGLAAAFDAEAMSQHLQAALFGPAQVDYTIERCQPGKVTYLDGVGCALRYELSVRAEATGEVFTPLVNARVLPGQAACEAYMRERLTPLANLMHGRPEIARFVTPAAIIAPLHMVVSVFPIDGELPTLVGATDRQRMREIFHHTLSADAADGFLVEDCQVELGHYGRQHRCLLRYQVEGRQPNLTETERQIIYGKVTLNGHGALANKALNLLRQQIVDGNSPYPINIPCLLGFEPDLQLTLLEAIPGQPRLGKLLQARLNSVRDAGPESPTLGEALDACARIAALLHTSGVSLGHPRTFEDELAELRLDLSAVRRVSPELGAQLQHYLESIEATAGQSEGMPLRFCHGDFTYSQIVLDHQSCGLVDFDTVCQAEPALDLGHFLAYLRLGVSKAQQAGSASPTTFEQLSEQFLHSYAAAAGELPDWDRLQQRLPLYQAISLLRMGLHSWQKLKSSRLKQVLCLLEEQVLCLSPLKS